MYLATGPHGESDAIAEMAREKSRLASELLDASRPLSKGCEATLAELASGFRLALASSGSRASVDAFLKLTGSLSLFTSALSGEDVAHAKPIPKFTCARPKHSAWTQGSVWLSRMPWPG